MIRSGLPKRSDILSASPRRSRACSHLFGLDHNWSSHPGESGLRMQARKPMALCPLNHHLEILQRPLIALITRRGDSVALTELEMSHELVKPLTGTLVWGVGVATLDCHNHIYAARDVHTGIRGWLVSNKAICCLGPGADLVQKHCHRHDKYFQVLEV